MSSEARRLTQAVQALRPMVPAIDFDTCRRFYVDLGFRPRALDARLVEMELGVFSFILQDYYDKQWADNFVMHVLVTDLDGWWQHIDALDLPSRYGVRTQAPWPESWGVVANVTDPSGVLWRFTQARVSGDVEG
jgi:catechol 2,3-dioxygenase-like lactoylglutathione lyase family enzyme